MSFSEDEVERYSRHILLKEIGGPGQKRLRESSVAIVGAGGLGSPLALYLAAAGMGKITLIDDDAVALSNLQRQILFTSGDTGQNKAVVAANHLHALNPDIEIVPVQERLDEANAAEVLADSDLVFDGCDNFPTRFLVNRVCREQGKVLVSGAVGRFDGQVSVHVPATHKYDAALPGNTACYQCLVPAEPPDAETCEQVGVVGALTGIIGSIMALEGIKIVTGAGTSLAGKLLIYDGLAAQSRTLTLPKDPACPVCGKV